MNNYIIRATGLKIAINESFCGRTWVRARTHKKKRIDKKWRKKYGLKEIREWKKCIVFNDTVFMTQRMFDKLKDNREVIKI